MSPPKSNQPSGKHETPNQEEQEDYGHDGDRDDESGFGVHEEDEEAPSGSSRPGTSRRENESDNDEVLPP